MRERCAQAPNYDYQEFQLGRIHESSKKLALTFELFSDKTFFKKNLQCFGHRFFFSILVWQSSERPDASIAAKKTFFKRGPFRSNEAQLELENPGIE